MYKFVIKRLIDFFGALFLLPLLLPIILIACIFILIDDFGNPFFVQERVGLNGRSFKLFKLRSMVVSSKQKSKEYKTAVNDVRVTKVGRIIRKLSLDELPQILNVFFGQMSFVGPRPDVPKMKALYLPEDWNKRCSVKPGITGLAQVNGRSEATQEGRLKWDLYYVEKISLLLDISTLIKTAAKVLKLKGTN